VSSLGSVFQKGAKFLPFGYCAEINYHNVQKQHFWEFSFFHAESAEGRKMQIKQIPCFSVSSVANVFSRLSFEKIA